MKHKATRGVFDIVPFYTLQKSEEYFRASELWQRVEETVRSICKSFGFLEIRTPLFESTDLFHRSVGETTDIVCKEMYTFEDRGERQLTLRPEGTAPAMRAFIEAHFEQRLSEHKLFYIGPMFRYERPQAGRYRQHHQFGAEAIGNGSPEQDVELIDFLYTFFCELGLKDLSVYINSIGTPESRGHYRQALLEYLSKHKEELSADSQARLETNPLRVLDSKDPKDIALVASAPSILDHLDEESRTHFTRVQQLLKQLNIPFEIRPTLVRGLDYYNKTVFEVVSGELGAQNSVGGGGRYDGLIKTLGGPDLPAIGFGSGMERIIQTLLQQDPSVARHEGPLCYLVPLGEKARDYCFSLLHKLRHNGLSAQMDFSGRKVGKVLAHADAIDAEFVFVIGDQELETDQLKVKVMRTGKTTTLSLSCLVEEMLTLVAMRHQRIVESVAAEATAELGRTQENQPRD